jgi:hypothetical protein
VIILYSVLVGFTHCHDPRFLSFSWYLVAFLRLNFGCGPGTLQYRRTTAFCNKCLVPCRQPEVVHRLLLREPTEARSAMELYVQFAAEALSLPYTAGLKAEELKYLLQAFCHINPVLFPYNFDHFHHRRGGSQLPRYSNRQLVGW